MNTKKIFNQIRKLDKELASRASFMIHHLGVDEEFVFDLVQRTEHNYGLYQWMRDHKSEITLRDLRECRGYMCKVFKQHYEKFSKLQGGKGYERKELLFS